MYRNIKLCTYSLIRYYEVLKYTILKHTITVRPIVAEDNFTLSSHMYV